MDEDLVQRISNKIVALQNERTALDQRRSQLTEAQRQCDTRMVELQGAIREMEIVIGRRDEKGQPILQAQKTETK